MADSTDRKTVSSSSIQEVPRATWSARARAGWWVGMPLFFFALYLSVSAATLYLSPQWAATLQPSDATEYAVSAYRLATRGSFDVVLAEKSYPTRYQPGFGVLFLVPIYLIDSSNPGLGILPVFFSAMITLLVIWRICRENLHGMVGIAAAFLALMAMLQVTHFYDCARTVMSDIPTLMLGMLALLAFRSAWKQPRVILFLAAGVLTGAAGSVRMTALSLCLPFVFLLVRSWRHLQPGQRFTFSLALFMPIAAATAATFAYNNAMFGSPFLTGYNFWLPGAKALMLEFNWEYFQRNIYECVNPFLPFPWQRSPGQGVIGPIVLSGIAVLGVLCRKLRPEGWKQSFPVLLFLIFGGLPIVLFHLFFGFTVARYFLFFQTLTVVLGVIWAAGFMDRLPRMAFPAIAGLVAVVSMVTHPPGLRGPQQERVEVVVAANQYLPPDATLISPLNGMYVHAMVIEGTERRYIPFDRRTPFGWKDGLFEFNALDAPERVKDLIRQGRRVYIHLTRRIPNQDRKALDRFLKDFQLQRVFGDEDTQSLAELLLGEEPIPTRLDVSSEELYQRTLGIREQALGADHLWVAVTLSHLAELYTAQKQYSRAEPCYQRALAIREKNWGSDHPGVAAALDNLAALYTRMGRTEEAKRLKERARAIRSKNR